MIASILRRTALAGALLVGVSAGPAVAATSTGDAGVASLAGSALPTPQEVSGEFDALVDFSTLKLQPVAGGCRLTVSGTLVFSGTLEGSAYGTTTALVFAPCQEVATTPPGTFADVFSFEGTFDGTVAGVPVTGPLRYAGVTYPGGAIDAAITLGGDVPLAARAAATLAVGGSYTGVTLI